MKRWAGLGFVAGALALMHAAPSCVAGSERAPGTAVQRDDSPGWKIIQGADFNRDGMADVLWNDPVTNRISIWLMDGTRLLAPGPWLEGPGGAGWAAVTSADFNADGMDDVLWFNGTTNQMAIWLMNGAELLARGPDLPSPGDGWLAVTTGDFNLDGMADVVWHNAATNQMAIWLMNGTQLLAPGAAIPGPDDGDW